MLPVQSGFARLFQPWQPQVIEEPAQLDQLQFIELPPVSSYQQLLNARDFPAIQNQFLAEILELKRLAYQYVNHRYDRALDVFRAKIESTQSFNYDVLMPIYRETRFQIHQLILLLRRHHRDHLPTTVEAHPKMACDDYITSVLHDCLDGIDLCLSGVHSRFSTVVPSLEAACATELDGKLYKIRNDLFRLFVQSFMLQLRREGCRVSTIMEIHWFNGLFNLYCENLALPLTVDPLAKHFLTDENLARYLSAAPLSVCAFTIMQTLVSDWSEQMAAALASVGCSHWLTGPVRGDENTAAGVNILNNQVFRPINNMMGISNPLNFMVVMDSVGDDSFHLKRHREKMFAWASKHLCAASTTVFAAINGGASGMYIGTIGHIYFWVFRSSQLHIGQACVLPPELELSVQLPHLQTIDFSTWPETTALALLTQALEQTTDGEDVAAFFLNPEVIRQLAMLPEFIRQSLSAQLREKLLSAGGSFQQALYHQLCHYFADCTNLRFSTKLFDWLTDTLLKPVLYELKQRSIDIAQFTAQLDCWQISTFTLQQMRELLTPEDCQRLFRDALAQEQADTLCHLLSTGHCDLLTELRSNEHRLTPLALFACRGKLAGVQYLLSRLVPSLEAIDINGCTPLQRAADNGYTLIVRALLAVPGLSVNATDSHGWSALHHATAKGQTGCVREILRSTWTDINLRTADGDTSLNLAAQTGHVDCLLELLNASGIDVNLPDCNSCTPLYNACYFRHMPCFTALLATPGIAINKCNHLGSTALNNAARMGLSKMLQALLQITGINVNLPDNSGRTPLHSAAEKRNVECIRLLTVAPGLDPNALTGEGISPLHIAAALGYSDVVRELLKSPGIRVNSVTCNGWTPMRWAVEKGHQECVQELLQVPGIQTNSQTPDTSLLVAQVIMGRPWRALVLRSLKKEGTAINDKFLGMSALNKVAGMGYVKILKELLEVPGIDVNSIDNFGVTPLHAAVIGNFLECVEALLSMPDIEVNQAILTCGWTALYLAARSGFYGCTRALLKAENIRVNQTAHNGQTALHVAAELGMEGCLEVLLLAPGIDVNKRDIKGLTPLYQAAVNGRRGCVKVLLRVAAVDVNAADNCSITPLHGAVLKNQLECVRLLLSAPGIDVNQMTNRGVTALNFAIECGTLECVRELLRVTRLQVNLACCQRMPPLHNAALRGQWEFIRALLEVPGIKVNKRSITGDTALNLAANKGHLECVRELLKAPDIDVNLGANDGSTPLHSAASKGNLACVLALIGTSGVDLKKKNLIGMTPLDLADQNGHHGCYKLIAGKLSSLFPDCSDLL